MCVQACYTPVRVAVHVYELRSATVSFGMNYLAEYIEKRENMAIA